MAASGATTHRHQPAGMGEGTRAKKPGGGGGGSSYVTGRGSAGTEEAAGPPVMGEESEGSTPAATAYLPESGGSEGKTGQTTRSRGAPG